MFEEKKEEAHIAASLDNVQTLHEQSLANASAALASPNVQERTNGLKMLLVMMSKGYDVSEFAPMVVQEVASQDPLGRQLAYVYLNHYADDALDSIVLAVNTFQRSLTDSDPLCRALAIKVMSSIRSREVLPAVKDAVQQVAGDASPYVKKAASFAIIKAAELSEDESETEEYLPILERFLNDESLITFSGAIAAYWSLCPDNIELLHPRFRWICQNMGKLDPWAQVFTLRSLTVYARYCFKNPSQDSETDESQVAFWDESAQKDTMSSDLILLLSSTKKLLMSPNPSVVLAAVSLLFYCGPASQISSVARPLIRLLYDSQITAQIALTTIITIASVHQHIFIPHMSHFYVRRNDLVAVKKLKLRILAMLASPANADQILAELSMYTGSSDVEFASEAVKTMGKTAMANDDIIPSCLVYLLKLMGRSEGQILAEVVLVIAHILRKNRGTDDEAHALKQLCRKFLVIKDPQARAAVLSIVGDMHRVHPEFAPQLLKHIAKHFNEEPAEVRLQSLTLASKLISCGTQSKIPIYVLKLGERDNEYDVRDRARFLCALIETKATEISSKLQGLLFPERSAPNWTQADNFGTDFQIGTFSHFFNRELDGYEGLPDWAPEEEIPDESVRYSKAQASISKSYETSYGDDQEQDGEEAADLNSFFSDDQDDDDEKEYYSEAEEEEEEPEEAPQAQVDEVDQNDEDDFFN
jgi:AP-3 complex subunit beta